MDSLPLLPGCKILIAESWIVRKLLRFVLPSATPQTPPTIFPRNRRLWGLPTLYYGYRGLARPGIVGRPERGQYRLQAVADIRQATAVRERDYFGFLRG